MSSRKRPTHYICTKCRVSNYIATAKRIKTKCSSCGMTYEVIPDKKYSILHVIPVVKNLYKLY